MFSSWCILCTTASRWTHLRGQWARSSPGGSTSQDYHGISHEVECTSSSQSESGTHLGIYTRNECTMTCSSICSTWLCFFGIFSWHLYLIEIFFIKWLFVVIFNQWWYLASSHWFLWTLLGNFMSSVYQLSTMLTQCPLAYTSHSNLIC